jgi:hypothetical protein
LQSDGEELGTSHKVDWGLNIKNLEAGHIAVYNDYRLSATFSEQSLLMTT